MPNHTRKYKITVHNQPLEDGTPTDPDTYADVMEWGVDELGNFGVFQRVMGEKDLVMVALYFEPVKITAEVQADTGDDDDSEDL